MKYFLLFALLISFPANTHAQTLTLDGLDRIQQGFSWETERNIYASCNQGKGKKLDLQLKQEEEWNRIWTSSSNLLKFGPLLGLLPVVSLLMGAGNTALLFLPSDHQTKFDWALGGIIMGGLTALIGIGAFIFGWAISGNGGWDGVWWGMIWRSFLFWLPAAIFALVPSILSMNKLSNPTGSQNNPLHHSTTSISLVSGVF
ncbi:MAG: hypothetical protein H6728_01290 [Myxococcales bacterium]|nr:hypothetical protein [Myxococcales bacterium]MCB9641687.1 hypothetical protein [Myxococcales bacterium]